jgi:glycosyltransferase involved in cell wall biosynthesis
MPEKKKVLVLSDHALSTSGVGTQTRHLINGLLSRHPGHWTFRQFGAALKHSNYDTVVVNEDFVIKPIDGFGSRDMIRVALATEKPDILFIFTDPRFFIWLFEMEDEVHQTCPIVWWHVWDNDPYPSFNHVLYESTDLINCHSHMTYDLIKDRITPEVNFIPHAVPEGLFFPISSTEKMSYKRQILGDDRVDHFVGIWVNRNAKRKRPADVIESWKIFLEKLEKKHGHRKATLIMHTDPHDQEGPNLIKNAELHGVTDSIFFSNERLEFEKMNILYNISDFCLNISYAEGFGLTTLEAMMTGCPIIALKTGGLTRQVVDHRDGTENGVAIPVEFRSLVGSQQVPFIYEDYCTNETTGDSILKLHELKPSERKELRNKCLDYAKTQFGIEKTVDDWHDTMISLLDRWKEDYKRYECFTL